MTNAEPPSATVPATTAATRTDTIPAWITALFAGAVVLAFNFSLGLGALAEPDEARYAEIAREILVRHDWVTPTLNYVKYFEKPPLVYWLTAITFRAFGTHDWVARLVPVLAAMGTLALTWTLGRRAYNSWVGTVGTGVLATSPLFFAMGQTLTLDMPLTLWLTAALVCFWLGYHNVMRQRGLYCAMYVCVALGMLTKGPVAVVLTGGVIMGFLVVMRDWRTVMRLLDPVGITLFALVALPWFIAVSVRNPEFVHFFIVDQHLKRFLSPNEHRQPIWFFLPFVVASLIPWDLALALVPKPWRLVPRPRQWSPITWFCALWAGIIVVFFSLSASKLVTYILPALPPLALLTARAMQKVLASETPIGRRLAMFFTILGWGMLAGGGAAGLLHLDPIVPRILPSLCVGGLVMVVTGAVMRRANQPRTALAVAACGWLLLLSTAIASRDVTTSYRRLGGVIDASAGAADRVVIYRHYVQGIPFYAHRRVVLVGARGELAFGSEQGDQSAFFWRHDDKLLEAWASPTRLFLVINRTELAALRPQLSSPPIQIAAEGKKVVVINHPLSRPQAES
jgi:4-amino-4-deoxy-L-arabinose transferase-like glycosyltransferase